MLLLLPPGFPTACHAWPRHSGKVQCGRELGHRSPRTWMSRYHTGESPEPETKSSYWTFTDLLCDLGWTSLVMHPPPFFFPVGKHSWPFWTSVSSLVKWGPTTSRTGFSSCAQHAVLRQTVPSHPVPGGEMTVMERFLQGRRHGPDKTVFLLSLKLHNPVWGDCWKVGPGVEGGEHDLACGLSRICHLE